MNQKMSGIQFSGERRSEEEALAYARCMAKMAGSELDQDDIDALRRLYRRETTQYEELSTLHAQATRRSGEDASSNEQ